MLEEHYDYVIAGGGCHPVDYDHWASLGNRGWGWPDLLPYFRKSECTEHGHR